MTVTLVCVLTIGCAMNVVTSLRFHDISMMEHSGYTDVKVVPVFGRPNARVKRFSSPFTEEMRIHMTVEDKLLSLNLKKNRKMQENIPIYVVRDDVVVQEYLDPPKKQQSYYQNSEYGASFVVELNDDDTTTSHSLVGTFFIDNNMYIIQPADNQTDGSSHVVAALKDNGRTPIDPDLDPLVEIANDPKARSKRQATGNYKIELFIVTDYSVYLKWYQRSTDFGHQAKNTYAKTAIREMYQSILNGMDTRYGNLANQDLRISVVAVGFLIGDSTASMSFIENNKITGSLDQINSAAALASFNTWITTAEGVPPYDHAIIFSAYELLQTSFELSLGLAYVGEMCTARSLSIVENRFDFIVITVASHEMGHSLNARHDGDANTCSSASGYIMSIMNTALLEEKALNPWRFSSCTVTAMKEKIVQLDGSSNNCLLVNNAVNITISMSDILPGQRYTADTQCQYMQGLSSSYVCRTLLNHDYSDLCKGLWCKKASSTNCQLSLPADGTSCGNGKWCMGGNCISSSQAPQVPETCPFGDRPQPVFNGLTCAQIWSSDRRLCYEGDIQEACCSTCIGNSQYPGCEFGDRNNDCQSIIAMQCYTQQNVDLCCEKCRNYETGDANCLYGDRTTGCSESHCGVPALKALCCNTCKGVVVVTEPTTTTTTTKSQPQPTTTTKSQPQPTTTTKSQPQPTTTTKSLSGPTTTPSGVPITTPSPKESGLTDVEIGAIAGGGALFLLILIAAFCLCSRKSDPNKKHFYPKRSGAVRKHSSKKKKDSSGMRRAKSLETKPKRRQDESRRRKSSADKYRLQKGFSSSPYFKPSPLDMSRKRSRSPSRGKRGRSSSPPKKNGRY